MRLETLTINNFRNYDNASVSFNADTVCIVGENGAGKTNLIDAIYYLMLTKSALNNVDSQNINHEKEYFFIKSKLEKKEKRYEILLAFEKNKKKVVKVNDKEYEKISDHIGEYPVVMIAPDDVEIILGGSEQRRKFFDGTLAQTDHDYLDHLLKYQRYLKQRNSALKQFHERGKVDHALLDLYDQHLMTHGTIIYERRKEHIEVFIEDFNNNYSILSEGKEQVEISYQTDLDNFQSRNKKEDRKKDIILQRTTWGIHKDDFLFLIDGQPVKKFASQGQRKSFLTALKLAQFDYIRKVKGFKPLLLLDDIFDKLDDRRIDKLIQLINEKRFGQIFLTDARVDRTQNLFEKKKLNFQLIKIADGKIIEDGK
ncbi:MAG: DNA replication/repair protein RecF [Candidatus Cyclobacteriaceae bacterium M2_1C_046]